MSNARDVAIVIVTLFITAMALFVVFFTSKVMIYRLSTLAVFNSTNTTGSMAQYTALQDTGKTVDKSDYAFLCVFIGYILALLIAGFFVAGYPIFMFLYFVVIVITVLVSMALSNAWYNITTASIWSQILPGFTVETAMPITNHIITYLPVYAGIIGLLGLAVMFIKPSIAGGSGGF
jgi:hypothetical protein